MGRTDTDIAGVRRVQATYGLRTEREVVDVALRRLPVEPVTRPEALAAEASGGDGDLDRLGAGKIRRR